MSKPLELTGEKFGKLTAIKIHHKNNKGCNIWECRCDCGAIVYVQATKLRNGNTQSCGCLQKERTSVSSSKHGCSNSRIYHIWANMKSRCYNPNNKKYKNYGDRGIIVCDEWLKSFESFYNWAVNNGYQENLTIDRIDVDGNYEPSNCRWANMTAQANNRTNNHLLSCQGENKTLSEWSNETGISPNLLWYRAHKNKPVDEILATTKQEPIRYSTQNGESHTLQEWSMITGIKEPTIRNRIKKLKWSVDKAVNGPVMNKSRKEQEHETNQI